MSGMFEDAVSFNVGIGLWDVSSVVDMSTMFKTAVVFNQDLSGWNVNNVTNSTDFATGATSWTLPKPNF